MMRLSFKHAPCKIKNDIKLDSSKGHLMMWGLCDVTVLGRWEELATREEPVGLYTADSHGLTYSFRHPLDVSVSTT